MENPILGPDGRFTIPASERQYEVAFGNLDVRWKAYEKYAVNKVDFYERAFKKVTDFIPLGQDDTVIDVGCNDARRFNQAAYACSIESRLIGVDPYDSNYLLNPKEFAYSENFEFKKLYAEDLKLPDNIAKATMFIFSLYEVKSIEAAISEAKRVTQAGGLVLVATNSKGNKPTQRADELKLTEHFKLIIPELEHLEPPASSIYLEDAPQILQDAGGLELLDDSVRQDSKIIWPREAFPDYAETLMTKKDSLNVRVLGSAWHDAVHGVIKRDFDAAIDAMEQANRANGIEDPGYYLDYAHRGLLIFRNNK